MTYENTLCGTFISRPNRFIALVEIAGVQQVCHVKNTGRCKELLVPGAKVIVQHCPAPGRKTAYDLLCVYKGDRLINMDAAAPNRIFGEYLAGGTFAPDVAGIRPECVHEDSRFDFFFTRGNAPCFAEVKGVTLEENNVVLFPDAPTLRGLKHVNGLIRCTQQGYGAYLIFIVQMDGAAYFTPNAATQPEFAAALRSAQACGVQIKAYSCRVTPAQAYINGEIPVRL